MQEKYRKRLEYQDFFLYLNNETNKTTKEIMETQITRLDYKNPVNGRQYSFLPALDSVKKITDINEVRTVSFVFDSKEEGEQFLANFPKSYRPSLGMCGGYQDEKGNYYSKPFASITFNTFWTNKNTGEINETAVSKREKFIKKLKSITE